MMITGIIIAILITSVLVFIDHNNKDKNNIGNILSDKKCGLCGEQCRQYSYYKDMWFVYCDNRGFCNNFTVCTISPKEWDVKYLIDIEDAKKQANDDRVMDNLFNNKNSNISIKQGVRKLYDYYNTLRDEKHKGDGL